MKLSRRILVCLFLLFGCFPISAQAPEVDVLNREGDERVTSMEERQQTVSILVEAARVARESGDYLKAARFMNRVGRLQLLLNLPEEASATFQEVLKTLNENDTSARIETLNGAAMAYTNLSQCPKAKQALQTAIALSDQTSNKAGKAQALLTLSDCQNSENHVLALQTAQQALELWTSVGNKWGMGKSHSAIGHYQLTLQKFTESAASHEAALAIWRELNIPYEEAQALINLGFVEYRKGAWQSAISFLLQGQNLLDEKAYPFEMGQITITFGQIFIDIGLPDAAFSNLHQATEYFGRAKSPLGVAVVGLEIGKANYIEGKYPDAIITLTRTIEEAEKIDTPNLVAMCEEFLGQTYVALNDPATALTHFETALRLFTQVSGVMEAARVQARMGQAYTLQNKLENANTYYQKALTTFQSLSDRLNASATLFALGQLKMTQNDLGTAEEYLRQSIDVTEDMRRTPTSSDLTVAFSATTHERYERYIDCLMRQRAKQPSKNLAVSAFELSEKSRGRSLKELLQATRTNLIPPGIDSQLAQREQSLRQSLTVKENYKITLLSHKYKPEELVALDAELAQLESQYKQTIQAIEAQSRSYVQMSQPSSWDLRRIQEQVVVNDDTVLLEYSIGKDRSYAWTITRDQIVSHELPAEAVITEAAQKVYTLLSAAPGAETETNLAQASNQLSSLVLQPLGESLNKPRIIVVADDALNYIPFQMLPDPSANSQPLIDRHEIINAPSASILGELRQETARRQPPAKMLAAFGDPVFPSNYALYKGSGAGELVAGVQPGADRWRTALRDIKVEGDTVDPTNIEPLFYTTRELANLREVAGSETLIITGFEASRETLFKTDLSQYAIVHFATHGVLDPKKPENSGLFLSMVNRDAKEQNGFIGLQDIYGLNARVDLVVLSACRTGLGKEVRGEGLIGLTRGFMHAGASSAVASLWSVDDQATSELMKHFYSNMLQNGMPPAAALREAQNTIRKDRRWSSPYYWSAFTFQGNYDQRISVPSPGGWSNRMKVVVVVSVVGVLLLGTVVWVRLRRGRAV